MLCLDLDFTRQCCYQIASSLSLHSIKNAHSHQHTTLCRDDVAEETLRCAYSSEVPFQILNNQSQTLQRPYGSGSFSDRMKPDQDAKASFGCCRETQHFASVVAMHSGSPTRFDMPLLEHGHLHRTFSRCQRKLKSMVRRLRFPNGPRCYSALRRPTNPQTSTYATGTDEHGCQTCCGHVKAWTAGGISTADMVIGGAAGSSGLVLV
jgi:hypothetical protein